MEDYMINGSAAGAESELRAGMERCSDFVLRHIKSGNAFGFVCFLKNVTDRKYTADRIIAPLMTYDFDGDFESCLQCASINKVADMKCAVSDMMGGGVICVLEYEGVLYAASCAADAIKTRSIGEPNSDVSLKGPKVGFVESLDENIAQMRRIVRSDKLKSEILTVGKISRTPVAVVYVEGRANMKTVDIIKKRLLGTEIPYIVDSGNIEMIFESGRTEFLPIFGSTEKADKAASKLLSGRVGVICEGSPFVLTAPYLFTESLQSTDDYLRSPYYSSFIRVLRFAALLISLLLPAVFIALMNFHRNIIPEKFLDLITKKDEGIPFSVAAEVLIMLLAFEIIREVGVRMPRTVGDTVGIVASLILGDAAVEAGLASTIVIIIVAAGAVCAFVVPAYMNAISILRLVYFFASFLAGFYGLGAALLVSVVSLARKKSFGVPYLYPFFPLDLKGMADTLVCIPRKVLGRKEIG